MNNIDSNKIFSDKKKINSILDKLNHESISFEDVESAIIKLSKFDNEQVLDTLLKRLEGSNSDFFVANYILRELGNETIVKPVINLIFEKPLSDERKAVLVSLLDELNIDLSGFNFNNVFEDIGKIGKMAVDSLLKELENDYTTLDKAVEWLYDIPEEARLSFIDAICESNNEKSFDFLQKLLTSNDKVLVKQILQNLARLNSPLAISTIRDYLPYITDPEIISYAERSLRKLQFKGISEPVKKKPAPASKAGEVYKVLITNIDGIGSQSLWLSRFFKKKLDCMFLLINEKTGIKDCFGNKMTKKQFDDMIAYQFDEGVIIKDIDYDKAINLIKDALFINYTNDTLIAPAFHFIKEKVIIEKKLEPQEYFPEFKEFDLEKLADNTGLLKITNLILSSIPECESWFIINDYIYDVADDLLEQNDYADIVKPDKKCLKEVVRENLVQEIHSLKRRLLLTADLLNSEPERENNIDNIELLLCAAVTLEKKPAGHPFLLAIADDSLHQAQITLMNGLDYRQNPEYFD